MFGPRHAVSQTLLRWVSLPVVSSYKYLGVLLTPTLSWTKHVQLLISRGNRRFAQCVAWCRAEHLPVHMASSSMFSPVSRGGQNFSHNHQQHSTSWMVQFADGVVTFSAGLPAHPVLVYFANLDGLTLNLAMGRLLSLLGSSFSMARGLECPLPATCGVSIARDVGPPCTAMCAHLDIPSPLAPGIHPQSPPHRVRRWVDLVVSPSLNLALHQRLQDSIHSFPMVPRSPSMLALMSSCMAEEVLRSMRGSGASPLGVMTPSLVDALQDIMVPESCRFCHASVGDMCHSLSECSEFADLRAQWSRRCRISQQFAQAWSRHSWIFDPSTIEV